MLHTAYASVAVILSRPRSAPIDDRVSRVAVPAERKIDATDEGHGAVDHDDLFMMTPVHVRGEPRSVTKDEDASSIEDVVDVLERRLACHELFGSIPGTS